MEDAIYQVFQVISHNGFYAVLTIASLAVLISFATIFFKSYKEYHITISNVYHMDKKISSVNIGIPSSEVNTVVMESVTEPEISVQTVVDQNTDGFKRLIAIGIDNNTRKQMVSLPRPVVTKLLSSKNTTAEHKNDIYTEGYHSNHAMIDQMLRELHKNSIKKVV